MLSSNTICCSVQQATTETAPSLRPVQSGLIVQAAPWKETNLTNIPLLMGSKRCQAHKKDRTVQVEVSEAGEGETKTKIVQVEGVEEVTADEITQEGKGVQVKAETCPEHLGFHLPPWGRRS